jgi:hypothetical protein
MAAEPDKAIASSSSIVVHLGPEAFKTKESSLVPEIFVFVFISFTSFH